MKFMAAILAASFVIGSAVNAARAEETTTTTTTTSQTFALQAGASYVVVDPTTGLSRGVYDPVTRMINGRPVPAGYYVIDQTSGKTMATVDASGNLVTLSTIPTALPEHFMVVDNNLVYFASDYALRRAKIERRMNDEYTAGKLSKDQVADLNNKLSEIASLDSKRNSKGELKSGTRRRIEKDFDAVQSKMDKDIALINEKRAKIGIRVN
ncbi:MAG: hypothetical protein P4L53_01185 [Candidatus Obscuribacterales bacterium]|nr:hypothetical protein [Candidatus Obscuribacterales bacterium]